jgi:cold-inducible RNA-binding protein
LSSKSLFLTACLLFVDETKLYIGNISFDTEQETLRELFEDYGPIVDLYVPLDSESGRPRGFAFVTLEPDNAQRAIEEVDGWEVDGRMLRVNEAQPKGSGGGGGGYNGGGGGYRSESAPTNEW